LGHTVITSPIDGIVISRNVSVGQTVAASMSAPTLFVIANDLTRMQVDASVDEADIGQIRAGQAARFRVDAYPNDVFTGIVAQVRLEAFVLQNVVSYLTVIDICCDRSQVCVVTLNRDSSRANEAALSHDQLHASFFVSLDMHLDEIRRLMRATVQARYLPDSPLPSTRLS
jgi:hypothetical protein